MSTIPISSTVPTTGVITLGSRRIEVSRTVEYWLHTLFWTSAAIALCAACYLIEKYGLQMKARGLSRMFANPAEVAMRIFGLPHFIVGLIFMLSARRMRTPVGWVWFFGLLAMGFAFAWVFAHFGAHRNPVMLIAFYFYFLIHGFRDDAFFYRTYDPPPPDNSVQQQRVVVALQWMILPLLIALMMPTFLQYSQMKGELPQDDPVLDFFFPASSSFLTKFAMYLIPTLIFNGLLYAKVQRQYPGGWQRVWREHHPLMVVFLGSMAVVLGALFLGAWTFNFIVLAHFVGWYLFAIRKLRKIPAQAVAPPSKPLTWMRTSVVGFRFLHLGLAAAIVVLLAISAYGFGNKGMLEFLFGTSSFYYWTVMHVSLSFYPR